MNKLMMPVFFVFFIILLVRVTTLPNALDGYRYLAAKRQGGAVINETFLYRGWQGDEGV